MGTVFNNTEIILAENNTNPLVNIAWRSGEDIYITSILTTAYYLQIMFSVQVIKLVG